MNICVFSVRSVHRHTFERLAGLRASSACHEIQVMYSARVLVLWCPPCPAGCRAPEGMFWTSETFLISVKCLEHVQKRSLTLAFLHCSPCQCLYRNSTLKMDHQGQRRAIKWCQGGSLHDADSGRPATVPERGHCTG